MYSFIGANIQLISCNRVAIIARCRQDDGADYVRGIRLACNQEKDETATLTGCRDLTIVTRDSEEDVQDALGIIHIVPAWKWFLGR